MRFLSSSERGLAESIARLAAANPFLPERLDCERAALGDEFVAEEAVWSFRADVIQERTNIALLQHRAEQLAKTLRRRLAERAQPNDQELKSVSQYARRHGLANTCRMLLNTNEFLFVD